MNEIQYNFCHFQPFHVAIEGMAGSGGDQQQQQNPPNSQKHSSLAADIRRQLYQDHLEKVCARIKLVADGPNKNSD